MREDIAGPRGASSRPMWETLEGMVREKAQEFIQQIMEEEVTELLATVCELKLQTGGGTPGYAVSNHSVGDHKQLTHAGGEGDFRRLATFCEPLLEDADRGITLTSGQGRHVDGVPLTVEGGGSGESPC